MEYRPGAMSFVLTQWIDPKIGKVLDAAGDRFVEEIRSEIQISSEASSPGSPPNSQTGALLEGVKAEVNGDTLTVSSSHADNPMIPTWLEFGTKTAAARPYMAPVYYRAESIVENAAGEVLK